MNRTFGGVSVFERSENEDIQKTISRAAALDLCLYVRMFGAWVLAGIAGIIASELGMFGADGPPGFALVIALGGGLLNSYRWLRIPFEIKILDDAIIPFRSLLRTTTVSPAEIKSVRAKRYALGLVDVLYRTGTVHLLSQMDGVHDLILSPQLSH